MYVEFCSEHIDASVRKTLVNIYLTALEHIVQSRNDGTVYYPSDNYFAYKYGFVKYKKGLHL